MKVRVSIVFADHTAVDFLSVGKLEEFVFQLDPKCGLFICKDDKGNLRAFNPDFIVSFHVEQETE